MWIYIRIMTALRNIPFRNLLAGVTLSQLGDVCFIVALPWLVLQMTGSAAVLGSVLVAVAIPRAALMLLGGAVSDRISARTVLLAANIALTLCVAAIALLAFRHALALWMLYALAIAFGITDAFTMPAFKVLIPAVVPREELTAANSMLQSATQVCLLGGGALAGLLIQRFGVVPALAIDSCSFVFLIVAVAGTKTAQAVRLHAKSLIASVHEGVVYVMRDASTRTLLVVIGAVNFCLIGATQVGIAALVHVRFGSAAYYGALVTTVAIGSLLGILLAGIIRLPAGVPQAVLAASDRRNRHDLTGQRRGGGIHQRARRFGVAGKRRPGSPGPRDESRRALIGRPCARVARRERNHRAGEPEPALRCCGMLSCDRCRRGLDGRLAGLPLLSTFRMLTRGRWLQLLGASLAVSGCSGTGSAVRIGSLDSDENVTVAEIYALALQRAKIPFERRMRSGDLTTAIAALQRGEIDVLPAYVKTMDGRGWTGAPPNAVDPRDVHGITALAPAPMNASPALATTGFVAERYWLVSLSKCAELAPQLRLAATHDFLAPGGMLEHLQRAYGGFRFKSVTAVEPGKQYDALGAEEADIANAFTTDPAIAERDFNLLFDDRRFWPRYSVTPLVRDASLRVHPELSATLDRVSGMLNMYAIQAIAMHLDLQLLDPPNEADYFFQVHRRLARKEQGGAP